jgi:DNA modification methylase
LLRRIIEASSNRGDMVADFFCGSGTTLVVAKRLNRGWMGCDLNPGAVKIARRRLAAVEVEVGEPVCRGNGEGQNNGAAGKPKGA